MGQPVLDHAGAGRVDLLLLNEGQRMKRRAYDVARGNINDRSGLVLVCANPPTKRGDQQWVSDFAAEASRVLRHPTGGRIMADGIKGKINADE